jgi:low temperature requirement protein LtrA
MRNAKTMPHPAPLTRSLFRSHGAHQAAKVSMVELFFDLVFVFAITQLSHSLLARPTPLGALQTVMLLLAVWSLWNYACWATNALDPELVPVRLLLFALMLVGLVVSMSIPSAFEGGAWAFAVGYVLMHGIRCVFILWAARAEPLHRRQNYLRNLFWVALTGLFWLAGASAEPERRLLWWLSAIGIELISPWFLYWTPGLGASKTSDWVIDGAHMAERCALFVIIALGESLLITGSTFAREPFGATGAAGFASAFFATVAMWWIYFHEGAEHAAHQIARSSDPGRTARVAYSYIHIAIVAGIIVSAVGDEVVLVHPDHADTPAIVAVIGGPALFLLGCTLFKWVSYERRTPPLSHCVGLLALGALCVGAQMHWFSTLQLGITTAVVLMMVGAWETLALRRP